MKRHPPSLILLSGADYAHVKVGSDVGKGENTGSDWPDDLERARGSRDKLLILFERCNRSRPADLRICAFRRRRKCG
jgi:hypothetical protein